MKIPNPGNKRVWRIYDRRGLATADLLGLDDENPCLSQTIKLHHPSDPRAYRELDCRSVTEIEPLLVDVMVDGRVIYSYPSIENMRLQRDRDLEKLDPGIKRIMNPHVYHVSLTPRLWDLKQGLISEYMPDTD